MAVHAPITGAPMRAIALPPVLAFLMGVPVAPRDAVERTIQAAIDALDLIDGDPDLEPDGDELDGNLSEDDFMRHGEPSKGEPGCPVSDPGGIEPLSRLRAVYGDDQTAGPINIGDAGRYETLIEYRGEALLRGRLDEAAKLKQQIIAIESRAGFGPAPDCASSQSQIQ